ncbi:MAG: hypothetical protein AAGA42_06270 [Actinomycetota bacterium]
MTKREFVDALVEVAFDQVISGEISTLLDPPGRSPSTDLVARSEWFSGLPEDDRSLVVDSMRSAAYGVLHRVLCVLDGVAAVDSRPNKGALTLTYERDGSSVDLTSRAEADLHALLAEHR